MDKSPRRQSSVDLHLRLDSWLGTQRREESRLKPGRPAITPGPRERNTPCYVVFRTGPRCKMVPRPSRQTEAEELEYFGERASAPFHETVGERVAESSVRPAVRDRRSEAG